MKPPDANYFHSGPRLTITFAVLIALILGGNGLLVWQFRIARLETDRLTGANQQLILVLRLRENLLIFHQRLDELAQSRDAHRLVTEGETLRKTLLEQTERMKTAVTHLTAEAYVNPDFLPTLQAIEIPLRSQLEAITALATSGDWEAVRLRLARELEPTEALTSALVKSIDQETSGELSRSAANMSSVQRRIFFLVPSLAIPTFVIALFFAWAIARRIMELRLEERVSERMRIAHELHDTLLQSFQGLMFRLQAVRDLLPGRASEAMQALDVALDRGDRAIAEGRDTVADLREPIMGDSDIAQALTAVGNELALQSGNGLVPRVDVLLEGKQRELNPILRDEIYRIAREALRNAFRHARAQKIEAEITYTDSEFLLHVRDDGGGIDPEIANQGARAGHWGLPGMRERAKRFGGKLEVWSEHGAGTEIELSVPGTIAYGKSEPRRRFWLGRKKIGESDGQQS
jgi:signal transduction histidine kinase